MTEGFYLDPHRDDMYSIYKHINKGWVEMTGGFPSTEESGVIVLVVGIMNDYFSKDHGRNT